MIDTLLDISSPAPILLSSLSAVITPALRCLDSIVSPFICSPVIVFASILFAVIVLLAISLPVMELATILSAVMLCLVIAFPSIVEYDFSEVLFSEFIA